MIKRMSSFLNPKHIKEIMVYYLISIIACFVFGPNVALLLAPVILYYFVRLLIDLVELVKNKFKDKEVFWQRFISMNVICAIFYIGHNVQVHYGQKNFREAVIKIKKHKEMNGDYPVSLKEARVRENPYLSLIGPSFHYKYSKDDSNLKFPIFFLVVVSPFLRSSYDFKNDKEVILD